MDRDLMRDLVPFIAAGVVAAGSLGLAAWMDVRAIREARMSARDADVYSRHAADPQSWTSAGPYLRARGKGSSARGGVTSSGSRSRRRSA